MFVIMNQAGKLLKVDPQINPPHMWVDRVEEAKRFANQALAAHYNWFWLQQRHGYTGTEVIEE